MSTQELLWPGLDKEGWQMFSVYGRQNTRKGKKGVGRNGKTKKKTLSVLVIYASLHT